MRLLTARWVVPVDAPPIENGALLLAGDRILAVGRRRDVARPAGAERRDLGDAALLPGLVNCHTHLELGAIGPVDAPDFVAWLLAVRARRAAVPPEAQAAAVVQAGRALRQSGVTCVGEVSSTGQSARLLRGLGLRAVVFHEVLGVDSDRAPAILAAARAVLEAEESDDRLIPGLSPHSAYALSEALLRGAAALARSTATPWCIHVAESREEAEYLATGRGDIPDRLYPAVGAAPPPRHRARSPVAYLAGLDALAGGLLVHAVHCDVRDIGLLARHGARVAHCPRSNLALVGRTAPLETLLAHGVPVGLGTDSLASAPTLSLWDEIRAARAADARLSASTALRLATLGGARALGLADRVGSLAPGKQADLIAVETTAARGADVAEAVITAGAAAVRLSLVAGAPVHEAAEVTTACD